MNKILSQEIGNTVACMQQEIKNIIMFLIMSVILCVTRKMMSVMLTWLDPVVYFRDHQMRYAVTLDIKPGHGEYVEIRV